MANALMRKSGIYLIGNFAAKLTNVLIIPIYAYAVSADALGSFDYYQAITQMAMPICFIALWEGVLRFIIVISDKKQQQRASTTVVTFSLILSCVLLLLTVLLALVAPATGKSMCYLIAMTTCMGLAQIWQYLARAFHESRIYALSGIVGALVNFFAIIAFVCLLHMQMVGLLLSYLLGQVAIFSVIEIRLHLVSMFSVRSFNWKFLRTLLLFSAPLSVNLALLAALTSFGRILIVNSLGEDQNGLYTFAYKFGAIIVALGSIFSMAVIEEAILRVGKSGSDLFFREVMKSSTIFLVALSCLALPAVRLFYTLISASSYAPSFPLVPAFLIFAISSVLATETTAVFQAASHTGFIALSTLVGVLIAAVVSLLSISHFGLAGVAWSLAIGTACMFLMRYWVSRRYIRYSLLSTSSILLALLLAASSFFAVSPFVSQRVWIQVIWMMAATCVLLPVLLKSLRNINRLPDL